MLVVVGGHTRNIGKTSVICSIISGIPEAGWIAIKITQHGHGVCSTSGSSCDCAPASALHPWALDQEPGPSASDSGRFLRAGARESWWLRTAQGQLGEAVTPLRELVGHGDVIIESNSVLQFFRPDLYVVVIDFHNPDMKESTRRYLDRADAFVVTGGGHARTRWNGIPQRWFQGKPHFRAHAPEFVDEALIEWIRARRQVAKSGG
jgi:hypothetical protein